MLLVDDTEINLDILEGIFEADFIILKALNGKQALKVLKSQKVDIVILDVVMPEMDGFGVLEAMKEDRSIFPDNNIFPQYHIRIRGVLIIFPPSLNDTSFI